MSTQLSNQQVGKEMFEQLEGTFEQVNGIYLDRGTSLLDTLSALNASEASKPLTNHGASIAGHVAHVRFYLNVMTKYMAGERDQRPDWMQSWLVREVNESEWIKLRSDLRDDYQKIRAAWQADHDWGAEDQLGTAVAISLHTSYHLGPIRQIAKP
ncbi:MAG: DinB family protein [Candidatus Zixiibacteriota bacterium]